MPCTTAERFLVTYPLYALVESAAIQDGETVFDGPLTLSLIGQTVQAEAAWPMFTDEPALQEFASRHDLTGYVAIVIGQSHQLRDVLNKVRSSVTHVAMDPRPEKMRSDRLWHIEHMLAQLANQIECGT